MSQFRYDGRVFDRVERALFGETAAIERQSKIRVSEMTDSEQMALLMLISLRRGGVMLTWDDMMNSVSPTDFEDVPEPIVAADEVVPPTAGVEAGSVATDTSGDGVNA